MKLAIVRARYNPFGGAERFVALALDALQGEGAEVTLLARQWQDLGAHGSMRVEQIDPFYLGSTWRDRSFAAGVCAILKANTFDLVQSHERIVGVDIYRAGDGVHAAWLERRAKKLGPLARLGIALNLHHRYLRAVERRMFEDPHLRAVICNSELVKDEIAERFRISPERLHVIYNGVDLERYRPELRQQHCVSMRRMHGIESNTPVLLFLGSGFARKGLADALRAVASIGDVILMVVGHDKHAQRYRALAERLGIAGRCRFIGPVADPAPYYGMSDGLVLPTLYDPFPNVALEALACGLPILVSNACGAREVVKNGSNGFVIPVGDVPTLAARMAEWADLVAEPADDQAMRAAARSSALRFDVASMGRRLLDLYRALQANPSR